MRFTSLLILLYGQFYKIQLYPFIPVGDGHFDLTLNRFKLNELVTTETELKAIAPPATTGFNSPRAAMGIPMIL